MLPRREMIREAMTMKRTAVLSLLLCLLLTGCVPLTSELHQFDEQYEMPMPQEAAPAPAVGDDIRPRTVFASLYFPAIDRMELVLERNVITVEPGKTLPLCLVEALLKGPSSSGARPLAPEGTSVLSVRQSGETVVVDLSMEARSLESPRQLFLLRAALTNTLCDAEGISCVDVLISGHALPIFEIPCGAGFGSDVSMPAQWSQAQSESELAGDGAFISRTVVLYHPARGSRLIIPEALEIFIEGGDALGAVLNAMVDDARLPAALRSTLPDSDATLITGAELVSLMDGRRVVRLIFDGNLSAILDRAHMSPWQMYASLVCTFTGFLPDLDGVQVYVGDGQLTRVESPEGEVVLENGFMPRSLFERTIGQLETIYMTASDGSLKPLGRAMTPEDALSPRQVLAFLFDEPRLWETDVSRAVPDGLSVDDLLGIRVEDGEATLNLSAAFYAGCQRLNSQQERNLVFALVNTLTEHADVGAVRFQIEGERVDILVHDISLLAPLVRNPGIISGP